jgi:hypothetical protein
VLAVDEGAFQRQIDEADRNAVIPDRHLAQHQRPRARRLQIAQNVAQPALGAVDLVDEQKPRQVEGIELLEDELQGRGFLVVGLAHHDGGVAAFQRIARLLGEFDRAGAVDESVGLVEERRGGDIDLHRHALGAGFRGGVGNGIAFAHLALALDRAGAKQNRFEQRRLATQVRAHDRDAAWTLGRSTVVAGHDRTSS